MPFSSLKWNLSLFVVLLSLGLSNATYAISSNFKQDRQLFLEAEQALNLKRISKFRSKLAQIKDYPIAPYLEHDYISRNLSKYSHKQLSQFLKKYKDYPFSYRLRGKWLKKLAKQKKWKEFLKVYDGRNNVAIKCQSFEARIAQNKISNLINDIQSVWLSGYSQPKECDKPFAYMLSHSNDPNSVTWQRIEKAFKTGKSSLARYLAKKLPQKDQDKVYEWSLAHKRPEKTLNNLKKFKATAINTKIIAHAIYRLVRRDVVKGHQQWNKLKDKYPFTQSQKNQIIQRIALSGAYQHVPQAKQWLKDLPEHLKNNKTDTWLARINIRDQDWKGVIEAVNAMPEQLQQDTEWQYWVARAFSALGYQAKSDTVYKHLAKKGSYYGFLAADKLKLPYAINNENVTSKIDEKQLLKNNKHLFRARELFYVKRTLDARREWSRGVKKLKVNQIKRAAKLASRWQWYDNAIKTVAKTRHRTDYNLRFPTPYKSLVYKNADTKQLDPSVIYGVMRRESLFDPQAGSRVGALGLMQLMPSTAKRVAKTLGLKRPKKSDILNVKNNIHLGTSYFKKVLSKFDNNTALAAAAYNAGPNSVKRWLPEQDKMDADLWVETIPYNETRHYVQAVLAYASIFDKALGQEKKISGRMKPVKNQY